MASDILDRKKTHFVLWRPPGDVLPPTLIIGVFNAGNPPTVEGVEEHTLSQSSQHPDLWEISSEDCNLVDGTVYHYWLAVDNRVPGSQGERIRVADPFATTVDYRVLSDPGFRPASVILFQNGQLVPCDPGGEVIALEETVQLSNLPTNNRMVMYEMPASWSRGGIEDADTQERDVGTFRDVIALLDVSEPGANFSDADAVAGRAHLEELGINSLELLPPADAAARREWGYATANYFAPDYDLGFPEGHASPTAGSDLARLVSKCHEMNIRFFTDIVMAFGHDSYRNINFSDFHLIPSNERSNPDSYQSSRNNELRQDFGGSCWRYQSRVDSYDPVTGTRRQFNPASQFMLAHLMYWIQAYHVDGIRIDSVNNIASWNFIQTFTEEARSLWSQRWSGNSQGERDGRFLVLGEELSLPLDLIHQDRVDALWNEHFQSRVRAAIIGEGYHDNFEWTVRKMIDCRLLGFADGTQAINYVTTHDTEGFRKERLFNFLNNSGIPDTSPRIKLAFVCLMTAVGIPMILAGEEFADQHDQEIRHPEKQQDPVNYMRVNEFWRRDLFNYVARLVGFRKASNALAVNDTEFIHIDFDGGRRILAWVRGRAGIDDPVVVVANFSDNGTVGPRYTVHNWPPTPSGRRWREVTQQREVPPEWVGQEPLFPWEAKVYTLV